MKKELYVKLVIYKDCTKMHGQQNIKFYGFLYPRAVDQSGADFHAHDIAVSLTCVKKKGKALF
jgi:hypothetical protein